MLKYPFDRMDTEASIVASRLYKTEASVSRHYKKAYVALTVSILFYKIKVIPLMPCIQNIGCYTLSIDIKVAHNLYMTCSLYELNPSVLPQGTASLRRRDSIVIVFTSSVAAVPGSRVVFELIGNSKLSSASIIQLAELVQLKLKLTLSEQLLYIIAINCWLCELARLEVTSFNLK